MKNNFQNIKSKAIKDSFWIPNLPILVMKTISNHLESYFTGIVERQGSPTFQLPLVIVCGAFVFFIIFSIINEGFLPIETTEIVLVDE